MSGLKIGDWVRYRNEPPGTKRIGRVIRIDRIAGLSKSHPIWVEWLPPGRCSIPFEAQLVRVSPLLLLAMEA